MVASIGDVQNLASLQFLVRKVTQLFSDSGKKGNPFWGRPFLVGQPPKTKGEKGATEQLR